jgi:hypothetical protein
MTKSRVFLSSVALSLLLSPLVPLASTASAQPMPPPVPELRVRVVPSDRPHDVRPREVVPYDARPSKNHQWIKGYYHHDGSDWRWNDGRWAEPPARHARWIAPQYKKVHGGTRYVPGHWSTEVVIQN